MLNINEIKFGTDKSAEIFSDIAQRAAQYIKSNKNVNKTTQLRKFYDELGRKTLPCSKGIETTKRVLIWKETRVVRHCPVPKGLRPTCRSCTPNCPASRKTLPCSKGIETLTLFYLSPNSLS